MTKFLNKFPIIPYDMENKKNKLQNAEFVTNIFFRVAIIREILNNTSTYFQYVVRDGETPEILADKFYNDVDGHWVILYANDIYDPQYDWPLNYRSFQNYLIKKYRAQAEFYLGSGLADYQVIDWTRDTTSANSVHHYEKIIERTNSVTRVRDEKIIKINYDDEWVTAGISVPFDTYVNLPETTNEIFNLGTSGAANNLGTTITQITTKKSVTYFDYEEEQNELKRNIKVIKKQYYPQIVSELTTLTNTKNYSRRLIV